MSPDCSALIIPGTGVGSGVDGGVGGVASKEAWLHSVPTEPRLSRLCQGVSVAEWGATVLPKAIHIGRCRYVSV